MIESSRRDAMLLALGTAAAATLPAGAAARTRADCEPGREGAGAGWGRGVEGQRVADLGNGRFRNPVLPGDHADPSVLRDGDTWYKVSSSFHYDPGLVIWKSHDLVSWEPVGPALRKALGSVYAPDIVKHDGRFFIYFPVANFELLAELQRGKTPDRPIIANYVIHADRIEGPWSDPVDLQIYDGIDPGHVVGEDGKRYLFISEGRLVPLSDDGLRRTGKAEKVYDGWHYPEDWVVEAFALESPKVVRRGGWFYMFSAQGGTAGPPTGHMVTVARSRSVRGPWENSPLNPMVRTLSAHEPWWSRGHATAVEGPAGDWWLVYHAYENGFRTLGRQMILEPFEWTADGWPRATGGDLSRPLPKPRGGRSTGKGTALSGPFTEAGLGARFAFYKGGDTWRDRFRLDGGAIVLAAKGGSAADSSPLVFNPGDRSYEMSVKLDLEGEAEGGLILFYNEQYWSGLGADGKVVRSYKKGFSPPYLTPPAAPRRSLWLRVVNRENIATFLDSADGRTWRTVASVDVSGYHQNVADGFLNLRPALFAARSGSVRFSELAYRALG